MNTAKHLDERIKQALENLAATQDGQAWAAFEQRLDQAFSNGADAPSFDDVVSGKLNRLEVPLTPSDWGMMERMIEADETAEQLEQEASIDNLVQERLDGYEVAFQPHHWQLMAHRLEAEFFVRYHLLRCKAAEVGLMLLLLLTIVRFTPTLDGKLDKGQPGNWPIPAPTPQFPNLKAQPKASPAIADARTSAKPAPTNTVEAASTTVAPERMALSGKTEDTASNDKAGSSNTAAILDAPVNSYYEVSQLPSLGLPAVQTTAYPVSLFEAITVNRFLNNDMHTPTGQAMANAPLIASLNPLPIQSDFAWEVPQLPQHIFEKERKLRYSIFTSMDLAYVYTPPSKYSVFDTLITTDMDLRLASGYGGGITVGWKKDKWEVQTGGIYSFKRFIPNTPVFLFETVNYYIREEFYGVQLDIFQVPLNFNYHLKNEGKWRVYTDFGASGHLVTSSVYEIGTKRTPSFNNFAMAPKPSNLPDDDKSIREEKDFPDGLFDGGSIRDNFFLTANVGVGVERFVSPRWSLFLQPNYQHHILTDGIGANNEKLYNFSFHLGTKVSLK